MTSLRRSISSVPALVTFEAAARLGGFTLAAEELGVTQAAVSRQIKLIESELNVQLFQRGHRKVTLTPAGQVLARVLSTSFARIAETLDHVRQPAEEVVTIGATLAFSHFWLLPRLADFRAAHPGINLRLLAEDTPLDLRRPGVDVAVRYGLPPFDDAESVANFPDEVFAVASPGLTLPTPVPVIAFEPLEPSWLTWRRWSTMLGQPLGPEVIALRCNHYTDTITAAVAGEGVALGWGRLIADHLAQGRLIRLGPHAVAPPERYHVLLPVNRPSSAATRIFVNWIAGQFAPLG